MKNTKGRILSVDADGKTPAVSLDLDGYELVRAHSVADALNHGAAGNFDLILLDWVFEDGTGIDLCRKLRSTGASAPILFYAGDGQSDIGKAISAGAQGLLINPIDSADLLRSLSDTKRSMGIDAE